LARLMALPVPVVKRGDEAGLSVMAPAAIGRAAGSRGLLTMACFGPIAFDTDHSDSFGGSDVARN
jgi:hypothetical protein